MTQQGSVPAAVTRPTVMRISSERPGPSSALSRRQLRHQPTQRTGPRTHVMYGHHDFDTLRVPRGNSIVLNPWL